MPHSTMITCCFRPSRHKHGSASDLHDLAKHPCHANGPCLGIGSTDPEGESADDRRNHVIMAEGGGGAARDRTEPLDTYTCDICGQDKLTEENMQSHMLLEHVEGEISCPFCDLGGISADEMTWHINAEHLDAMTPTKLLPNEFPTTRLTIRDAPSVPKISNGLDTKDSSDSSLASRISDFGGELDERMETSSKSSEASDHRSDCVELSKGQNTDQWKSRAKLHLNVTAASPRKKQALNCTVRSAFVERLQPCQAEFVRIDDTPDDVTRGFRDDVLITTTDPNGNCNVYNTEASPARDECSDETFSCPFCEWSTTSTSEITRHVNVRHLDLLSPAPSTSETTSANQLNRDSENNIIKNLLSPCCPFCGIAMDACALEVHVNTKHLDLLSPDQRRTVESPDMLRTCPICGMEDLEAFSLAQHVDGHFSAEQTPVLEEASDNMLAQDLERRELLAQQYREQKEFEKLQATYGMDNKTDFLRQSEKNMERAVNNGQMSIADYYARKLDLQQSNALGVDDGSSCTKEILLKLEEYYKINNNSGTGSLLRYYLCSPLDHYASTYGDKGWGCGYRNLQMMLSSLSRDPTYKQVLFNGRAAIPSIPKIQRLIEAAWQKGFDVQGCDQLGGKVYNTNKWIGATEIFALLSSLRVKCQLIDFHAPSAIDGTHPRMFEWVRQYFSGETGVEFKAPLYLQHHGHSRTIIGVEELSDNSMKLLIFDPIYTKKQMQQFRGGINANMMRTVRRTVHSMKAKQYQIVSVVGVLCEREYDDSKIIKSERLS